MALAATVLEVPAAALTSALRRNPRSLNRCSRHGLPAEVYVDMNILAPGRRWRLWNDLQGLVEALEILFGVRARTPVSGWPLCARCWRRSRRARILGWILFAAGLVGVLGGCGVGLVLRLSTGQYAPTWVMAPPGLGFALLLGAAVSATVGRGDRTSRAETTRDGTLVRFTDPHQDFVDRLRALLGDQVRWAHPTDQPVAG